jgi:two-component system sensor histidine kinase KdpD
MLGGMTGLQRPIVALGLGLGVWVAGWAAMVLLDGRLDLANLALVFVLTSVLSALWLPGWLSLGATLVAATAFNWLFVPPRGTFAIDLRQHAVLLGSMLGVSGIVALLMAALRRRTLAHRDAAARAEQLRHWGETLRDADDPLVHVGGLRDALAALAGKGVALMIAKGKTPAQFDPEQVALVGTVDADQQAGLWHCLRQGEPMGPGTHRHRELPAWYLPMRGRADCRGAALITDVVSDEPDLRAHLQALCNQMGAALQRVQAARDEAQARERAQSQEVRNALLAAIAHDHRTPLATIIGAASSLQEQSTRLSIEQRQRLVRTILDEASRLSRVTDNTLQLARLDAPGMELRCDWESAEELVGTVLRRARERCPARVLKARVEPGLPLLWCDAILLSQLLDNLVDNAVKYSPADAPVELLVRRVADQVMLAVRDRGPGIAPAWRERVFDVFQRGADTLDAGASAQVEHHRPGVGVGLAVCRAIARVHGGELRLRARGHGGCAFEFLLPVKATPPEPGEGDR